MPIIYLSPSTQEGNYYVNGGTEEEYMNLLADKMVPYLDASGIRYTRNTPDMTAASSIAASNAGNYDLHLALHSNAAPEGKYGQVRGIIVFYYPTSQPGQRASTIIANNLKSIYPLPNLVRAQGTTTIGEVRRVRAPSAFLELDQGESGRGGPESGHVPHRLLRHPLPGPGAHPIRSGGCGLGGAEHPRPP